MQELESKGKIAVIDGNSLVFRAFYAIRGVMVTRRGLFTHAIFGFLNMLFKILEDVKPDFIAVAFDRKAPTFRHLEYAEYKAGRAKTPDELVMQIPYLKDILAAMNIAILELDTYEADDLIGTVAKRAEEAGLETLVITGDRDELQLVSEKVSVMVTKKGVTEFEVNTPEFMMEKYGFGPELFIDYKGLMGDSSDNIPGLPGVGEKTAEKLIRQFGSIEDIVARVEEVEPERIRKIIQDNEQMAFMSKRLATIVTNAPIEVDFETMRNREWDKARLHEIYTALEFNSFLKKLNYDGDAAGASGAAVVGGVAGTGADWAAGIEAGDVAGIAGDATGLAGAAGAAGATGTTGVAGAGAGSGSGSTFAYAEAAGLAGLVGAAGATGAGAGSGSGPTSTSAFAGAAGAAGAAGVSLRVVKNFIPEVVEPVAFDPQSIEISIVDSVKSLEEAREFLSGAEEAVLHMLGSADHSYPPAIDVIHIMVKRKLFCIWTRNDEALLLAACEMIASLEIGLIGFGLKDDIYRIRRILALASSSGGFRPRAWLDFGVADYLLAPGGSEPTFARLALTYGGIALREAPDFSQGILAYGNDDITGLGREFCAAAYALAPLFRKALEEAELSELFDQVEMPLTDTLAEIEVNGFFYDAGAMDEISDAITKRIDVLTKTIIELAGEPFNINSPRQLGEILFEKLGLKGGKKNKNGYSTSADILEKLVDDHPIIEQVLEYRMLVKLMGTYIEGLPAFVAEDGKIRAHLMQTITATGRLSCVDPNLQNIPIRKEPGRQLRRAFVPESEDYILMGADYSQIELRILAHLSGDPALIEDFRSGADIHRRTAARVFGVADDEEVTIEQRSGAKAVNFGIIYGMSSFGLSEELAITRKDAGRYIAEYFNKHESVRGYMDGCIAEARAKGYTTTIMGRKRPIPEIAASQYVVRQLGERLAMNSPVQGSAADIIKVAMNRVRAALAEEGLESTLILQVHDELILQVKKSEEEAVARLLKREMEGAASLSVPLVAEVKTGANWYELK